MFEASWIMVPILASKVVDFCVVELVAYDVRNRGIWGAGSNILSIASAVHVHYMLEYTASRDFSSSSCKGIAPSDLGR